MKITKNLNGINKADIKTIYCSNMTPVINDRAMYADATKEYRCPAQPKEGDRVTLKFRTAKYNVDSVDVVVNGIDKCYF